MTIILGSEALEFLKCIILKRDFFSLIAQIELKKNLRVKTNEWILHLAKCCCYRKNS